MALVNLIRIDEFSGALMADEEFWRRGSRRTLSLDNLHPLLPDAFCEASEMEALIGIQGDPSITYETVLRVRNRMKEIIQDPSKIGRDEPIRSLRDVVDIAIKEMGQLIRKRIDDQLGFAYGFTADDLNRGFFEHQGQKIDIKQDQIRTDALKWIKPGAVEKTKQLSDFGVLIAGIDSKNGFHWYEWGASSGISAIGTGLFESIGKGSDAANLAFIDIFRKRELQKRRKGMTKEQALFALFEAYEAAIRFNHEVGGYPQVVILDGHQKQHNERMKEFSGQNTKLAQEIVTASVHEYLTRQDAIRLLKGLFSDNADPDEIEAQFLDSSKDARAMEHFLRGYKNAVAAMPEEI